MMLRRLLAAVVVAGAVMAGCGDDGNTSSTDAPDTGADVDDATTDAGDSATNENGGGEVVDPAPAGQAVVSVDGQEFVFVEVMPSGCSISDDAISFGFATDDGTTTIGAGLNNSDDGWMGSIAIDVPNSDGEGVVGYYPQPAEGITLTAGSVVVDGSSMRYSGPMLMQPPNDGSNPPPVEVGTGTVSATC